MHNCVNNINPATEDVCIYQHSAQLEICHPDVIMELYITPHKQFYMNMETNLIERIKSKIHLTSKEAFEWIEDNCPEYQSEVIRIMNSLDKTRLRNYRSTANKIWDFIKSNPNCTFKDISEKFKNVSSNPTPVIQYMLNLGIITTNREYSVNDRKYNAIGPKYMTKKIFKEYVKSESSKQSVVSTTDESGNMSINVDTQTVAPATVLNKIQEKSASLHAEEKTHANEKVEADTNTKAKKTSD